MIVNICNIIIFYLKGVVAPPRRKLRENEPSQQSLCQICLSLFNEKRNKLSIGAKNWKNAKIRNFKYLVPSIQTVHKTASNRKADKKTHNSSHMGRKIKQVARKKEEGQGKKSYLI